MKKIIALISLLFIFTACSLSDIDNTPTKKVEALFNNYQTLDKLVLDDLDLIIAKQNNYTSEQKDKYRDILKKHYQDLTYEIKDETINGDKAEVIVEIEVTDFYKTIENSKKYLKENRDEFLDSKNNYDESKYIDYELKKLKDTKETVKYTLNLTLTKKDKEWVLDDLSDEDEEKIIKSHYELGVIRKFEFATNLQRMSVLVRDVNDDFFKVFSKGSPEQIRDSCLKETIPPDFNEVLKKYTMKGFRVLAFSYKNVKISYLESQTIKREKLENKMIFLGLLIGRIKFKGVSLGSAGVFIIALIYGALFSDHISSTVSQKANGKKVDISSNALKVIENMGLIFFYWFSRIYFRSYIFQ